MLWKQMTEPKHVNTRFRKI